MSATVGAWLAEMQAPDHVIESCDAGYRIDAAIADLVMARIGTPYAVYLHEDEPPVQRRPSPSSLAWDVWRRVAADAQTLPQVEEQIAIVPWGIYRVRLTLEDGTVDVKTVVRVGVLTTEQPGVESTCRVLHYLAERAK